MASHAALEKPWGRKQYRYTPQTPGEGLSGGTCPLLVEPPLNSLLQEGLE